MKRLLMVALMLGLVTTSLAAPSLAAKKKKAKPVATVLYAHGVNQLGEADGVQWVADGAGTPPTTLDAVEPAGPAPKSMTIANPGLNDQCAGIPLAFPTFQGDFSGTIVGDAKLFATFASAPGTIKARLWTDTPVFSCNDAYIEPASEVDVELPAGQGEVEIVFPGLNLTGASTIMIEILALSGTDYKGQVGRLLYDHSSALTRLEFNCVPAAGAKTCTP